MAELTFDQFSRKLLGAAKGVGASEAKITLAGANGLAGVVDAAYRGASGDGRLSGTGNSKRGSGRQAPVGAKAKDVRRYSDGTYVGLVAPTGAYGLLERDIAPHEISVFSFSKGARLRAVNKVVRAARKSGSSARAAAILARAGLDSRQVRALKLPGGSGSGYARSVQHPGTRGKRVFSTAVKAGGPAINAKMLAETSRQLVAGYQGRA